MWIASWVWGLAFIGSGLISGMLAHQIIDAIERDLPISERPSWKLWQVRRMALKEVRIHSQMYPARRKIRMWWYITTALTATILFGGFFVAAIIGTYRR